MPKKIPMRQCLGCHEMKPKTGLIRIVRSSQGEILLDRRGKIQGRGAYVCADAACIKRAIKTRALERALGTKIPDELIDKLTAELEDKSYG